MTMMMQSFRWISSSTSSTTSISRMMAAAAISTTTAITSRMTPAASLAATTTRSSRICDILNPMYTTRIYNKNVRSLSTTSNEEESKNNDKQYEYILTETRGNVGMITLHRPKALNALCDGLFADLIHAAKSYQNNDEIGCIVLTGSPKSFAAGADISEMKDRNFDYAYQKNMFREWADITSISKPIIAAVNGYCLGGGCELAMMCDIILAGDTAKFGQPEINLGVIPGAGGTQRLTRAIGKSKAMMYCLTGDLMDAETAERAGLVAKVVPADKLVDKAVEMATQIACKGRMATMMAKEAVNASQELSLQEGLRLERRLFHSLFATHDQKEGMAAFLEKRSPNFTHK